MTEVPETTFYRDATAHYTSPKRRDAVERCTRNSSHRVLRDAVERTAREPSGPLRVLDLGCGTADGLALRTEQHGDSPRSRPTTRQMIYHATRVPLRYQCLFVEKARDVVGLYLAPPDNAIVLCVDEKSQMQAIDRTAPTLPIMPTTPARMTHDDVRHGTTSLFAALNLATGSVIAQHHRRHRHQEFLKFLKTIDAATPGALELHLVRDNYATHKTPAIKNWLLQHPRFHAHFTPTSASWLNLVERWFAELTNRKRRRSAHRSVTELEADVEAWIGAWNDDPKPFVWAKTADQILASVVTGDDAWLDTFHDPF